MNRFDEDFPWPRRGDKLFTSEGSDWWNKACLTHFSDGWWIYATGYKLGADLLVQYVTETHKNQDRLIYPIVFLYRQYLELRLKELIKNGSTIIEESSDRCIMTFLGCGLRAGKYSRTFGPMVTLMT